MTLSKPSPPDEPVLANREYYDAFAAGYEVRRHHGYHLLIDQLQSELVLAPATGKEVLEVGCGTGLILKEVAEVAERAVGLDLSPEMLRQAEARGLEVVEGEATQLPFEDNRFDVCYSFKVLSHVEALPRALEEMARVTKPGGLVFAELYNRHSLRYLARRLRGGSAVAKNLHDNQVFFRFYTPGEMEACLPASLQLTARHGVRIFTTLPAMVAWPLAGPAIRYLERRFRSTWLARFGGFLVLECRKRG